MRYGFVRVSCVCMRADECGMCVMLDDVADECGMRAVGRYVSLFVGFSCHGHAYILAVCCFPGSRSIGTTHFRWLLLGLHDDNG